MKNYGCPHCGSTDVFLKEKGAQTGLYCGDCGKWIKWVSKSEKVLVERWIEENKEPIEQDKNVITDEQEVFMNLCSQISDYLKANYNPMTAILITDSQIKVIESVEGYVLNRGGTVC